jgi:hypothetical protein
MNSGDFLSACQEEVRFGDDLKAPIAFVTCCVRDWLDAVTWNAQLEMPGDSRMQITRIGAALLFILVPLGVMAQTATPPTTPAPSPGRSPALKQARAKMRAACATDLQKFCADVERGGGARRKCLRSHQTEISSECKSARRELRVTRAKEKS